jgi:hypothetical protein
MQRITQGLLAIVLTLLVGPFLAELLRVSALDAHLADAKGRWIGWRRR